MKSIPLYDLIQDVDEGENLEIYGFDPDGLATRRKKDLLLLLRRYPSLLDCKYHAKVEVNSLILC